jgi:hypothetical protein
MENLPLELFHEIAEDIQVNQPRYYPTPIGGTHQMMHVSLRSLFTYPTIQE